MGAGPEHLLRSGLAETLERAGHDVAVQTIETSATATLEAACDLARQTEHLTRTAFAAQRFPILLTGNCINTLGVLSAFDQPPALLWLDAHADLHTPETSTTSFLDGMALSVITGRCHTQHFQHTRLPEENVILLGVRDVDAGERAALASMQVVRSSRELWSALARIAAPNVYLHIDLDALDPAMLHANEFAAPRGLSLHTLHDVIAAAHANGGIGAAAFSAYDPAADHSNAAPGIVADLILRIVPPGM